MKNLLINYVSAVSGGAVTYMKNITPILLALEKKDRATQLRIKFLINEKQLKLLPENIDRSRFIIVGIKTGIYRLLWEYRNIPGIIENNNIDILFTPYQVTRLAKNTVNVVMLRNMEPFTFHKYKYSLKTLLRNYVLKFQTIYTIKNADKIIAVSKYVHDHIINNNYSSEYRLAQIYHGRDESFRPNNTEGDNSVLQSLGLSTEFIFTCGSLLPYRKCEDIINAFLQIKNPNNIKLVIAGAGTDNNYVSALYKLSGSSNNIIMLGHVSHDSMSCLFRRCQVFVTATETEACPNIAIEAMSSGCAILSSDVEPMPEVFASTAEFYEHGNVGQLAEKLAKLLSVPKKVNESALKRASDFSWAKCAEQTYKYLAS